ncbi:hypothetical protein H9P43_004271 [Blastocladiella emersonii ATCC 22665]|nr:hypothetical protein H9P43_004271 [Blastocladiella emersonii ATCC 22665]
MPSITKLALLAALATVAFAQNNGGDFKTANRVLAKRLDDGKAGLKIGSACPAELSTEGAVLCAGNQLARCNGGRVAGPLQSCGAGGLNCQVLPLVNSPGTSVTCSTDADKIARIGNVGAGAGNGAGGDTTNNNTGGAAMRRPRGNQQRGNNSNNSNNNTGAGAGRQQRDGQAAGDATSNNNAGKKAADGKKAGDATNNNTGGGMGAGKKAGDTANNNAGRGGAGGAKKGGDATNNNGAGAPGAGAGAGAGGDFKAKNKADAARLDSGKAAVSVGGACPAGAAEGSVVCAGDQIAFCLQGKVSAAQSCAGDLKCQVLPLVNKPGTSIACTTDADKNQRIRG